MSTTISFDPLTIENDDCSTRWTADELKSEILGQVQAYCLRAWGDKTEENFILSMRYLIEQMEAPRPLTLVDEFEFLVNQARRVCPRRLEKLMPKLEAAPTADDKVSVISDALFHYVWCSPGEDESALLDAMAADIEAARQRQHGKRSLTRLRDNFRKRYLPRLQRHIDCDCEP